MCFLEVFFGYDTVNVVVVVYCVNVWGRVWALLRDGGGQVVAGARRRSCLRSYDCVPNLRKVVWRCVLRKDGDGRGARLCSFGQYIPEVSNMLHSLSQHGGGIGEKQRKKCHRF